MKAPEMARPWRRSARPGRPQRSPLLLAAALAAVALVEPSAAQEPAGTAAAAASGAVALTGQPAGLPPLPRKKTLTGRAALIDMAERTARRHGLRPELVHAVILAESRYDPRALSHKGAMGLMQLMPATARRYGVADPWRPAANVDGGVRYLRDLMRQFEDLELVLAAYNAGENAVLRYGRSIPPFAETEVYVERVKGFYGRLQSGSSVAKLIARGSGVGSTRLSGWGVILGSYFDRKQARAAINDHRGALRSVTSGGRTAVVKREREGGQRYAALLVGLKEQDAGAACKLLWSRGAYCLTLPPDQLKDPKALWR